MIDEEIIQARIICQDCDFVAEVESNSDKHPVDVMNNHRQVTGHELRKERLER